jgi:Spy/CpxP family protein refolding chaperone
VKSLRSFIVPAAAAVALIVPVAVFAQQAPPAPSGAASPGAQPWQGGHRHRGGMMRMFRSLNLSQQQQTQIQQIMQQFRQSHPEGSPPDRQAREQMRSQIMNVLTPEQQAQLKQRMEQMRQERMQREGSEPEPDSTPQA